MVIFIGVSVEFCETRALPAGYFGMVVLEPEFAIKESAEYRQDKGYRDKKPK